jgi:shikimate kinase
VASKIVLIGPMGAGKSTIGRALAKKLGCAFFDSDHEVEARAGADISWIFDVEGEQGFRDREEAMLAELLDSDAECVIATGGGIVIREANRERLKSTQPVIYLSATLEQLVKRTAKDKKRPLLQVDDPKAKIKALVEERDPLYREVASEIVATGGKNPRSVVQKIIKSLH